MKEKNLMQMTDIIGPIMKPFSIDEDRFIDRPNDTGGGGEGVDDVEQGRASSDSRFPSLLLPSIESFLVRSSNYASGD